VNCDYKFRAQKRTRFEFYSYYKSCCLSICFL